MKLIYIIFYFIVKKSSYLMRSLIKKNSIQDIKQKHTIFAVNSPVRGQKLQTSMNIQSGGFSSSKLNQKSLYNSKYSQNNWLNPMQLLNRKHKINDLQKIQTKAKKKQHLIRKLQKQIPGMKTQSTINSTPINHLLHPKNQFSFHQVPHFNKNFQQKIQSRQKQFQLLINKRQDKPIQSQHKIRKVSVLSLSSTKSLNQAPSPQLAYNSKSQPKPLKNMKQQKPNLYLPITSKQTINEDLQNSHYNNQKYYKNNKQKAYTESDIDYESEINRLKKQLQKSSSIITSLRIRQLENQVIRLKEKDKRYESMIESLMINKQKRDQAERQLQKKQRQLEQQIKKQKQIQKQRQRQRQKQRQKQKQRQRQRQIQKMRQRQKQKQMEMLKEIQKQKQKQRERQRQKQKLRQKQKQRIKSLENQERKKQQNPKSGSKIMIPRSKTQMSNSELKSKSSLNENSKQRKSSEILQKKYQIEDQTYHVLADHLKQIESQKQFLLINPTKTRQKLQTCYSQLRKFICPEININPFRIPRIPKPPRQDQSVEDYIKLARELCNCLNLQIQQSDLDIVIRRYKNCINFKVLGSNDIVIWNFNGKLFVGAWKQLGEGQGKKEGKGMQFTDQYCFKGEFSDGKRSGQGIIQHYNGSVYQGQWKNGKMDGKGIFFDKANATYFQGQWEKGQQRGRGVIKYTKKHYYTGQFKNFTKSGKGTEFFENGDIYQGSLDKGQQNGHGIFYYQNGQFFVGNFQGSRRHGTGLHLSNKFAEIVKRGQKQKIQQYYYGQFNKGNKSGYGIQRKLDGTYFFGYFHNSLQHGPGIIQSSPYFGKNQGKNQLKITGIWRNGELAVTKKNVPPSQKTNSRQFSDTIN